MAHWLTRLLSPKTIAIVGASERDASLAAITHRQLSATGYRGDIFSVNPRYQQLHGMTCYSRLDELPVVPDLVVYAISGGVLEKSFSEALSLGVGGIVIYASNYLENDSEPRLTTRLRRLATEAGVPVCGGNSMGFYNYDDNVMVSFDHPPQGRKIGHIGLILHSGSGMTYLANNDSRFRFNYVISSAQETNASVGDYMDYLLDQSSTRVIAVILESVRDVPVFIAALQKARENNVPVVIMRLGRTEKSAELAKSHSGAIVGDHEAFVAVCARYGAILCRDTDEMIVTAMLLAETDRVAAGGLASMLDSGGMREQMIDLADDYGISFAQVSDVTTAVMRSQLESGLEAVNPMDGMGALGLNTHQTYLQCGKALLDDPDSGLLSFEFEFRDGFSHYPELFDVARQLQDYSCKPVILVNSCSFANVDQRAADLTSEGLPVINGIDVALRSIRNLMWHRDQQQLPLQDNATIAAGFDPGVKAHWMQRLSSHHSPFDEATSLQLMTDFGLPAVSFRHADSLAGVFTAAQDCGYPLVLKTAVSGISHKSDQRGVVVGIESRADLEAAYSNLQARLGDQVLLMPMVEAGVEVSIGMKNDPQFGPLVVLACGGVLVELLSERSFGLAPLNHNQVNALIDELRLAKLLDGVRGEVAVDRDSLVELVVRFSEMALGLSTLIEEIDLNPVIVNVSGCTIVDALVVPFALEVEPDGKFPGESLASCNQAEIQ